MTKVKKEKVFKPLVLITALIMYLRPETHSGPQQIYKIELLKVVNHSLNLLTIFVKKFILDVWKGPAYASAANRLKCSLNKTNVLIQSKTNYFMF